MDGDRQGEETATVYFHNSSMGSVKASPTKRCRELLGLIHRPHQKGIWRDIAMKRVR